MSWLDSLSKYNITYLSYFPETQPKNSLYCSRCCSIKTSLPEAIPKNFYLSSPVQKFISFCENNNFNYAILSDLYGIHFSNELKKTYDIHPSSLSESQFVSLGKLIHDKCSQQGIDTIYYYNSSPLMSVPYFKMLYYSSLKIFYLTKLSIAQSYTEIDDLLL